MSPKLTVRRASLLCTAAAMALLAGCSGNQDRAAAVNPATLTKEQRLKMIDGDSSLTPEQREEQRRKVEQLEQQTQMARQMAPPGGAPAGLKR